MSLVETGSERTSPATRTVLCGRGEWKRTVGPKFGGPNFRRQCTVRTASGKSDVARQITTTKLSLGVAVLRLAS